MPSDDTAALESEEAAMVPKQPQKTSYLSGARVYLSGPMGFVISRSAEKDTGWRNRVCQFLREMEVTIFDPWHKPPVRGFQDYGVEDVNAIKLKWSFEDSIEGDKARAECASLFSTTVRLDLRLVDTSDFMIACCPTNIYSVGTVHEIIRAREQSKPVLIVCPHIDYPSLDLLRTHLQENDDPEGSELSAKLVGEACIKPNPQGIPSSWYMPLIDPGMFFDGFGFAEYRNKFGWTKDTMDDLEERYPPKKPLLPYIEKLAQSSPKRWDDKLQKYVICDDWLLWDLDN